MGDMAAGRTGLDQLPEQARLAGFARNCDRAGDKAWCTILLGGAADDLLVCFSSDVRSKVNDHYTKQIVIVTVC